VASIAQGAGLAPERMYFDIARVARTSSASIPAGIFDAVGEGVIDRPMRAFAPGFGVGAVGGYTVMRVNPAIVARPTPTAVQHPSGTSTSPRPSRPKSGRCSRTRTQAPAPCREGAGGWVKQLRPA
jgi:hypothetical protein